jgi:hypothetical protein
MAPVVELALTPSRGLFGRVVDGGGHPAGDVDVAAEITVPFALNFRSATQDNPEVQVVNRLSGVTTGRTTPRGYFYLDCETRFAGASPRVIARSSDGQCATLFVEIPRLPALLPDLVLSSRARRPRSR